VTVVFDGGFKPSSVSSKVARCQVTGIDQQGMLRYHLGIAFNKAIELEDLPNQPPAVVATEEAVEAAAPGQATPTAALYNRW
jgi:hypothetical protein